MQGALPKLPEGSLKHIEAVERPFATELVPGGFLRREELARQLGLSLRTIDRWQPLRQGPPRVSMGRTVQHTIQSVSEWLTSKEPAHCASAPARRRWRGVPMVEFMTVVFWGKKARIQIARPTSMPVTLPTNAADTRIAHSGVNN
jgi:predicted DNA-binding transcriptional regulator AlpA